MCVVPLDVLGSHSNGVLYVVVVGHATALVPLLTALRNLVDSDNQRTGLVHGDGTTVGYFLLGTAVDGVGDGGIDGQQVLGSGAVERHGEGLAEALGNVRDGYNGVYQLNPASTNLDVNLLRDSFVLGGPCLKCTRLGSGQHSNTGVAGLVLSIPVVEGLLLSTGQYVVQCLALGESHLVDAVVTLYLTQSNNGLVGNSLVRLAGNLQAQTDIGLAGVTGAVDKHTAGTVVSTVGKRVAARLQGSAADVGDVVLDGLTNHLKRQLVPGSSSDGNQVGLVVDVETAGSVDSCRPATLTGSVTSLALGQLEQVVGVGGSSVTPVVGDVVLVSSTNDGNLMVTLVVSTVLLAVGIVTELLEVEGNFELVTRLGQGNAFPRGSAPDGVEAGTIEVCAIESQVKLHVVTVRRANEVDCGIRTVVLPVGQRGGLVRIVILVDNLRVSTCCCCEQRKYCCQ